MRSIRVELQAVQRKIAAGKVEGAKLVAVTAARVARRSPRGVAHSALADASEGCGWSPTRALLIRRGPPGQFVAVVLSLLASISRINPHTPYTRPPHHALHGFVIHALSVAWGSGSALRIHCQKAWVAFSKRSSPCPY